MNISKVAEEMNISPSTIRYYEKIDLIPPITRNEVGVRIFNEEDLKWIDFVKCMRTAGLSISVLKKYTELVREGDTTLEQRKEILVEERDKLKKIKEDMDIVLERLNYKITGYEGKLLQKERQMQ